ncbi:hypothetical protein [Shouchella lonarensis]|uniref:Uncharacterized protein n=1 Tax=Shouchella lonarensis TaxID=1464122 RepID=A0A1G6HRB6_9BACI|nr:hypothetical protein [Shouchella lonarensis]SDB96724.1 hypothetical protein SAMN05421737_104137 [Shouchella lonarensis]
MSTTRIVIRNYNEVMKEISIIEDLIAVTKKERDDWWEGGRLYKLVPLDNAAWRVDRLNERLSEMYQVLEELEYKRKEIEYKLSRLGGLEYQVAYKRYVEGKPLKAIARELCYSLERIKQVSAKINRQKV